MKPAHWILITLTALFTSACSEHYMKTHGEHDRDGTATDTSTKLESNNLLFDGESSARYKDPQSLRAAFNKAAGGEPQTGFASVIERSLDSLQRDYSVCDKARLEKAQWHLDNQGKIPASFGKIVNYDLYRFDEKNNYWAGRVALCTWIGVDEYYFVMDFPEDAETPLQLHERGNDPDNPFPGTLETFPQFLLDGIGENDWGWKMHGNGTSFSYTTAMRNGLALLETDPLFANPDENCFDIFFKADAEILDRVLPEQNGYCMGRCDVRIINTK